MNLAQRLYEAGYITYMRTDSVNLSQEAKKIYTVRLISLTGINIYNHEILKQKTKAPKRPMKQ